jgi:hypothetical protein
MYSYKVETATSASIVVNKLNNDFELVFIPVRFHMDFSRLNKYEKLDKTFVTFNSRTYCHDCTAELTLPDGEKARILMRTPILSCEKIFNVAHGRDKINEPPPKRSDVTSKENYLPVGHQCIFFSTEHYTNVRSMVNGRVEICVITC